MTTESGTRDLTAICAAADSGYILHVVRAGHSEPLAEKDLSHWPDWPTFPFDAAHAAGAELIMLGYMIWPDSITSDSRSSDGGRCQRARRGRRRSQRSTSCTRRESDRGGQNSESSRKAAHPAVPPLRSQDAVLRGPERPPRAFRSCGPTDRRAGESEWRCGHLPCFCPVQSW
ncbi:protein of unknown function [Streptomyces sp. KY75]|nr:protein of unknown function [Streptomyces sp. KY70]CAD5995437.1 protein of unknown function [Streptomyces sp. KY75]